MTTEWVSFTDDEGTTWLFDLTFLTSNWSCTFGKGCPGTEPGDEGARGCCAHGAHLMSDRERRRIVSYAARLTSDEWQNRDLVTVDDDLFETVEGDLITRSVDDACIFLNDVDFAGGHGCALHLGALKAGERPFTWKPTVCWQVPFRLEYYEDEAGTSTVALRAWRRSDWGEGGQHFGHWCTDSLQPATGDDATWLNHRDELNALVGRWPADQLANYLRNRQHEKSVSITAAPNKPT